MKFMSSFGRMDVMTPRKKFKTNDSGDQLGQNVLLVSFLTHSVTAVTNTVFRRITSTSMVPTPVEEGRTIRINQVYSKITVINIVFIGGDFFKDLSGQMLE